MKCKCIVMLTSPLASFWKSHPLCNILIQSSTEDVHWATLFKTNTPSVGNLKWTFVENSNVLSCWATLFESHTSSVQYLKFNLPQMNIGLLYLKSLLPLWEIYNGPSTGECEIQMYCHIQQLYLKVTPPLLGLLHTGGAWNSNVFSYSATLFKSHTPSAQLKY